MSVVAASIYRNGRAVPDPSRPPEAPWRLEKGEFVWIGLFEPEEEELLTLAERFGLHPLAVEDARVAHQMPKLEIYGDQLFVVARTARLENDEICYGETAIFVGHNFIITVRHGSARAHTELRRHLETAPDRLKHGVDFVLHGVLDFIVDGYAPIIDAIEEEVLALESRSLDCPLDKEEIHRIFRLRRHLTRFSRMLGPMQEMSARLEHLDLPCVDPEMRPYFRDVNDHVRRVEARVGGLREVLRSVFDVGMLIEQQQQSIVTRKLAAWAAILAVPTAIAGLYGMNFEHMPELKWAFGYPTVLLVIAALCGLLYVRFRKVGWL
ncbi:magnesium and cobalt transport protein CorA [Pseudoroseomonas wenyumeiae]|uniref:Magnesium and cobalt transport protein CorA n=1 Tax=Teichococcus wenyumeiae TaxID=2478470 RepID=A0A3A9JQ08_9PROT|nr:magnesium and cobalt transport protein CorA [Pseudoroseomonas wenyumeiae]RKK05894.1 magnesium and cobalt transport protein CorA [Pseudoroseomonas wenyumeiae]RMI25877.1 magnesium and cobalt transport protein CorA [Pseudoroseomonas wenyumeiae]